MAFLALAIDVGQLRYQRRNLQKAADAAALAAVLELPYCSGLSDCPALQQAARSALAENGVSTATLANDCAAGPTSGVVLTINHPPCSLGLKDPNMGKAKYIEVLLSQPQQTAFANIFGIGSMPLVARSEAGVTPGTNCIYALDPTGSGLVVQGGAAILSSCGIVVESSSSSALSCNLLGLITGSQINVVGGYTSFLCAFAPTPTTNVVMPNPADPLAYLPLPAVPACGTSVTSPFHGSAAALKITGTAVLYADGAYCGGIVIKPGANVTFQPGVYALTSSNGGVLAIPGGLSIDLGANVVGNGVTFYNFGPSGGITLNQPTLGFGIGGVSLTAPTTGTYAGMLFFQPASNTTSATLMGSAIWSTVLQGTYYFPKAKVTFAFDGPVSYNILVAYDIVFQFLSLGSGSLTSGFSNDYSSLANGSPLSGKGAVIAQ